MLQMQLQAVTAVQKPKLHLGRNPSVVPPMVMFPEAACLLLSPAAACPWRWSLTHGGGQLCLALDFDQVLVHACQCTYNVCCCCCCSLLLLLLLLVLLFSTAAAAGQEPEYTSSHSQFMDCCDYIWFTTTPLTQHTPTQQQQQQQQQQRTAPQQQHLQQVPEDRSNPANSSSSSSSNKSQQAGCYELRPVAVLQPPDGLRLPKGLPTKHLGSDHICLLTDFELLYRQDRV
jgi:hypothetical protein